ncbi:MAG: NAD(P)H-dependent oxidoreductase [Pseudomonadota bacterium]
MTQTLLRIDSSSTLQASTSRTLTDTLIDSLAPDSTILRDVVADPLPLIDQPWIEARLIDAGSRSAEENARLALSDRLVNELRAADTIVISAPMYNFGIPAALKAYIDLIARPAETFTYTEAGPKGLITGKRAFFVVTSGGTPIGSDWDFASPYLQHFLGFIGITDVTVVTKDTLPDIIGAKAA